MSWSKLIELQGGGRKEGMKEGIFYDENKEPLDIFHMELKALLPLMDRNFTIGVVLAVDEISNPYERRYKPIDSVFDRNGDLIHVDSYYNKTVDAVTIVSFILNNKSFYVPVVKDMDRLHLMLFKLIKKAEGYNNTMGLRPLDNGLVISAIRDYVRRLEEEKSYIIEIRKERAKEDNKSIFFGNGLSKTSRPIEKIGVSRARRILESSRQEAVEEETPRNLGRIIMRKVL